MLVDAQVDKGQGLTHGEVDVESITRIQLHVHSGERKGGGGGSTREPFPNFARKFGRDGFYHVRDAIDAQGEVHLFEGEAPGGGEK
jgi:hypothetical protein